MPAAPLALINRAQEQTEFEFLTQVNCRRIAVFSDLPQRLPYLLVYMHSIVEHICKDIALTPIWTT
jgi:hypothetical protein